MESVTNPTTKVEKVSKNYHDTLEESIAKMKLAFSNASLPQIFVVMVTVGYTAEKIAGLNTELTQFEALYQGQIKEYADQDEEQQKFNAERARVNTVFNQHRGIARIHFRGDTHAWVALQLDVENPKAYSSWLELTTNFYAQFEGNPAMQLKADTIGITATVVAAQKQAIAGVQALKESLRDETAQAQSATEARDKAFDILYPKYIDYIKFAKIMLPDSQSLEAIGVTVKAK